MAHLLPDDAEARRLAALVSLQVLDTPREDCFDRIVFIAAQLFRVRMAAIAFIAEDRVWFKAQVGLPAREMVRQTSFWQMPMHSRDPLVVADAGADARFRHNPAVTAAPHIQSYVGAPILGPDGDAVGTLCILDVVPHHFGLEKIHRLTVLAQETALLLSYRTSANRAFAQSSYGPSISRVHAV